MNECQQLWWEQAKSDYQVFLLLLRQGAAQCHSLHYLQMTAEKIAKAYLWRSDSPPPKTHKAFVQFLRFLGQTRQTDRERIANLFTFARFDDFQRWIRAVLPIAYDLEHLAPSLDNDGPNPEYPWPHRRPQNAPAHYQFEAWTKLTTGHGRDLMRVIGVAVNRFPEYADT